MISQEQKLISNNNEINSINVLLNDESLDNTTKNNLIKQKNTLLIDDLNKNIINNNKKYEELYKKLNKFENNTIIKLSKRKDEVNNIIKEINDINYSEVQEIEKLRSLIKKNTSDIKNIKKNILDINKYGDQIGNTIGDIGEFGENTIEDIGQLGNKHVTDLFNLLGIKKLLGIENINPFVLGLLIIGLILLIVYIIFVVILGKPMPKIYLPSGHVKSEVSDIPMPPGDVIEI
jgi:methyl-accepting chemotaxis protein